jgi:hypothetical protein
MNRKQLQKQKGQARRLCPTPVDITGIKRDDLWEVTDADDNGLHLRNQRTHHNLNLGFDHIHEYRTPDFLVLRSTVTLTPHGPELSPIVVAPKTTLEMATLPVPTQNSDGTWTQEIHVHPSRPDNVPDVTVEIIFRDAYQTGIYEVVANNATQALIIRELFGVEGRGDSSVFRMGLVELPRGTWLRFTFRGATQPKPREIRLNPYFKY